MRTGWICDESGIEIVGIALLLGTIACARILLVNALGTKFVGRWDRAMEFSATSKSDHDLVPITLLPIT